MFSVIQTRKNNSKPELFVVPTNWLMCDGKKVIYPPNNFNSLSSNAETQPEANWLESSCKFLCQRNTFVEADAAIADYLEKTDTSDAEVLGRGTRSTPAKRSKTFHTKTYDLMESTPVESTSSSSQQQQIQLDDLNNVSVLEDISLGQFDPNVFNATTIYQSNNNNVEKNDPIVLYVNGQPITGNFNIETLPIESASNDEAIIEESPSRSLTLEEKVDALIQKVDGLNQKFAQFDVISKKVDRLTEFMMNVEKLISDSSKSVQPTQTEQQEEDFSEFSQLKPAESAAELQLIENTLGNPDYCNKLFRFIKKNQSLDGKGNGKSIARYIIRFLMKPDACLNYTWKGQQRKGQSNPNLSFKTGFPKLIEFINRVACAGDISFALNKTEKIIETVLRNKHVDMKTPSDEPTPIRITPTDPQKECTPTDTQKERTPTDTQKECTTPTESTQSTSIN